MRILRALVLFWLSPRVRLVLVVAAVSALTTLNAVLIQPRDVQAQPVPGSENSPHVMLMVGYTRYPATQVFTTRTRCETAGITWKTLGSHDNKYACVPQ